MAFWLTELGSRSSYVVSTRTVLRIVRGKCASTTRRGLCLILLLLSSLETTTVTCLKAANLERCLKTERPSDYSMLKTCFIESYFIAACHNPYLCHPDLDGVSSRAFAHPDSFGSLHESPHKLDAPPSAWGSGQGCRSSFPLSHAAGTLVPCFDPNMPCPLHLHDIPVNVPAALFYSIRTPGAVSGSWRATMSQLGRLSRSCTPRYERQTVELTLHLQKMIVQTANPAHCIAWIHCCNHLGYIHSEDCGRLQQWGPRLEPTVDVQRPDRVGRWPQPTSMRSAYNKIDVASLRVTRPAPLHSLSSLERLGHHSSPSHMMSYASRC